jgi:hypothetical protein
MRRQTERAVIMQAHQIRALRPLKKRAGGSQDWLPHKRLKGGVDNPGGGPQPFSYFCSRGRLFDYGIRFVWYSGFLRPKARSMYGTAHSKNRPAG